MPDLLTILLASTADLVRGTLLLSIACFIVFILAQPLYKKISEKLEWKWLKASLLTSFIAMLVIVSIAYFVPFLASPKPVFSETELMPTTIELIGFSLLQIARVILVSLVLSLMLMPFALLSALANDYLSSRQPKKKKSLASRKWLNYFISILISSLIFLIIVLWLVPWAVSGLLYFIFFA